MKFKLCLVASVGLLLGACGGGSGDVVKIDDNAGVIPSDSLNQPDYVDNSGIDPDEYFQPFGVPVVNQIRLNFLSTSLQNYYIEEYERNLDLKIEENSDVKVYSRTDSVDLSKYTTTGSLEGYWKSSCVNYKEIAVGSSDSSNARYYSRIYKPDIQSGRLYMDIREFAGLGCDRSNQVYYDRVYSNPISTEVVDGVVVATRSWANYEESSHKVFFAEDGKSFIMYEGENTYISYTFIEP